MKNITQIAAVAAMGLLLTTGQSVAAKKVETTREAIMHKCNAQTLKQVPRGGQDWQALRATVWKDCMVSHGQQP